MEPAVAAVHNPAIVLRCVGVPELPDIVVYIEALEERILAQPLEHVRLASPFLLRSVNPPLQSVEGRKVRELRRVANRIPIGLEADLCLALPPLLPRRLPSRP